MKKYLLGFLCMLLFVGLSATSRDISLRDAQKLAAEGKIKQLPTSIAAKTIGTKHGAIKFAKNANISQQSLLNKQKAASKAFRPAKAPRKVTAAGANIYGYVSYSDDPDFWPGLAELTPSGYENLWSDPLFEDYYMNATNGWLVDDKIVGVFPDIYVGYIYGYYKYAFDFNTGELLDLVEYPLDQADIMFFISAFNPETNKIYGYAYNFNDDGELYWCVADADNPLDAEAVAFATEDFCYSLCFNPTDGNFYGVNINQEFVKVNEAGVQTVISEVPQEGAATYQTGIVYSPVAGKFYWNCNLTDDYDFASYLYTITPEGKFDLVMDFPYGEEFSYFLTTDVVTNPDKPTRPEVESLSFNNGALAGTVTFKLPATYGDERPLPSVINYTALLDNTTYKSATAAPGESVSVNYEVAESGFHTFGIFVTVDGVESSTASTRAFIGNDTPVAPANVALSTEKVTWSAVTTGVNNGFVDAAAVEYKVTLNGEPVGTTKNTEIAVSIPENEPLAGYVAEVVAVCNGLESAPASSNKLIAGEAFELPVHFAPTADDFDLMSIVSYNIDASAYAWAWGSEDDIDFVQSGYTNSDEPMDAYLFLPPVNIEDNSKYYTFSMYVALKSDWYPEEYVEVVYATAPNKDSVIGTIVKQYKPTAVPGYGDEWNYVEDLFKVPAAGQYYVAIHCISDGDQLGVMARDFTIEDNNITGDSPAAVSNLKLEAGEKGALEATASFTFPTETLDGDALDANLALTATVSLSGNDTPETVTGKPGQDASATLTTLQGNNTVTVVVSTADGLSSPKASAQVYTGVNLPAAPEEINIVAAPDMLSAEITWTPVTTAETLGGYVDPADITYTIHEYYDLGFFSTWLPLESGITGTSYSIKLEKGDPQQNYLYGIGADNAAGSSSKITFHYAFLGTPYELPFSEKLDDEEEALTTSPWYQYSSINGVSYNATWLLAQMSDVADVEDGDRYAMVAFTNGTAGKGALGMPRFSTKGCDSATLTIDLLTGPGTAPVKLFAQINESDKLIEFGEYSPESYTDEEITVLSYTLPTEVMGEYWVQVYLESDFSTPSDIFALCGAEVKSGSSSIATLPVNNSIAGGKGVITFRGFEGKHILVSTIDGRTVVNTSVASNEATFTVEKGIYVVKAGKRTAKVVVK